MPTAYSPGPSWSSSAKAYSTRFVYLGGLMPARKWASNFKDTVPTGIPAKISKGKPTQTTFADRNFFLNGQADFNHCGISGELNTSLEFALSQLKDSNRACLDGSVKTVKPREMGKDYTDPGNDPTKSHFMRFRPGCISSTRPRTSPTRSGNCSPLRSRKARRSPVTPSTSRRR